MKKIITSILMLGLCTFLTAQSVLNISGVVTNLDGTAEEGAYLSVDFENGMNYGTETDQNGFYQYAIDIDVSQGCFEVSLLDCTFEFVTSSGCFYPGNFDFNFDFVYCENSADSCLSFFLPEIQDSSFVILNVISFGLAPFTYIWNDGSTEASLILPFGATGEYCVTVTDSQGCESEPCYDLTPPDPCFVLIFSEYNFNSLILNAFGYGQTDELDYVWSTGESSQSIEITESGEYCVTISDGLGCESLDCGYFEVDTTWFADCFSYIYSTYEQNDIEILNVQSFGVAPFTYIWNFGDSIVSTSQSYAPSAAGEYCVTVTDAEDCVYSFCYDHFIWEDCGVWVGCDPIPNAVQLWAFGYGAEPIEYIWSDGTVGEQLLATENGEYCVTITDAEGCSSTTCVNVSIEDVAECFAPIEVIEFGGYSELSINPITDGEYEFIWSTGETGAMITVQESGVYCVEVLNVSTGCFFSTCEIVSIGGQEECWGWIQTEYNGDSSAILTVFPIDMTNDSLNYQYIWSTGEVTETIEVVEEGEYCVTVTGGTTCFFATCIEVTLWDFEQPNFLLGVAYDQGTGNVVDVIVDIYTVLDDGSLELYSEGNETFEEGFFYVENVEDGNYIVLAVPLNEDFVPTYGSSSTSWEAADVYAIGNIPNPILIEIAMIPITNISGSGNGTIAGNVTTENLVANGKDSDSRNGVPVEGANIILMHTEVPVGQIFTDDEGNYKFTGLPYGTYKVALEIPGYPRKIVEVTLSGENPNANDVTFETDSSVSTTENISVLSSLTLSPNPTSNILMVDAYFEEANEVSYRIVDMNGKIIKSSTFTAAIGENTLQIDVVSMNNGVYNLVVQSNEALIAKRFVKL